jgi:hypothetical protein
MCGNNVSLAFTDSNTDNNPERVSSQSFQEMLQSPKKVGHKRVTWKVLYSKAIVLKKSGRKRKHKEAKRSKSYGS